MSLAEFARTTIALLCIAAASAGAQGEPMKILLDSGWTWTRDTLEVGLGERWFDPGYDREGWDASAVSGDSAITGSVWWSTTFGFERTSEPFSLYCSGIDADVVIWLNGTVVGTHGDYREPFSFDVSRGLVTGDNLLVLRARTAGYAPNISGTLTLVETRHLDDLEKSPYYGMQARRSADWVRDGVVYEIYPRSFSPEGNFAGIEKRIPELRQLGVTILWLMPIHPVGVLRRKGTLGSPYSVKDFTAVNPEFGTLEEFKLLLRASHANGMKLIIDLAANHTSRDSKLLQEHPEWFAKDSSGSIVSPNADWTDVADLDYSSPALQKYMIDMMVWWVRDVGIDGFRCDVAELVPTAFWEKARERLDRIKPIMLLSEGSVPEHHLKAFDCTYSWNLYDVLPGILDGSVPVTIIDDLLKRESLRFPIGSLRLRFLSNHDKNAWDKPAILKYGLDGLKFCMVLTNTIPGIPLLYNGDDAGNPQRLDLFERVPISWKGGGVIDSVARMLFTLRRDHKALSRGSMVRVETGDEQVYAFFRIAGNDRVLVLLNPDTTGRTAGISLPPLLSGMQRLTMTDAVDGSQVDITSTAACTVAMSPRGYRVFTTK